MLGAGGALRAAFTVPTRTPSTGAIGVERHRAPGRGGARARAGLGEARAVWSRATGPTEPVHLPFTFAR